MARKISVSPSPLGTDWAFELGLTGLGLGQGVWGQKVWDWGLTIVLKTEKKAPLMIFSFNILYYSMSITLLFN